MHVYVLINSETDIHIFKNVCDLLPSIKITYSRCENVRIEQERDINDITFKVTGNHSNGDAILDKLTFKCIPVWESPSHV